MGANDEVEFVATVPSSMYSDLIQKHEFRTTLGALTELFSIAKEEIQIGAPFIQGEEALNVGPIGAALLGALGRGVRVDIVSTGKTLEWLDLRLFRTQGGSRLRTFQPRSNVDNPVILGSHAKFCVVDRAHAYLGSANITQNGISENLEMGVLMHGLQALRVYKFLKGLFESGYLVQRIDNV
jgi:phosphatidylserine/phosphatidylglycerophosphate/cardiolipin synthase-like enzyme